MSRNAELLARKKNAATPRGVGVMAPFFLPAALRTPSCGMRKAIVISTLLAALPCSIPAMPIR